MRERTASSVAFLGLAAAGVAALLFFVNELMRPDNLGELSLPLVALTAGVAATFNPCGLPALPGFLTFMGGADAARSLRRRSGLSLSAALGAASVVMLLGFVVALVGGGAKGVIAPYVRGVQVGVGVTLMLLAALHLAGKTAGLPLLGPVMTAGNRLWDRSVGRPTARSSYLFGAGFVAVGSG
ncbi:MAG: hypothetical protein V3S31_04825 [Dehalococcoidia bacterium]